MFLLRLSLRDGVLGRSRSARAAPMSATRRMMCLRSGVFLIMLSAPKWGIAGSQQAVWKGGDGNWADVSQWSGNVVPRNGSPRADSSYAVTINGVPLVPSSVVLTLPSTSIDDLTIDAGNTLSLSTTAQLRVLGLVQGGILNAGTINLSHSSVITLQALDPVFNGGGTINLLDPAVRLWPADGWVNQDQSIQGAGSLWNMQANRGMIAATGPLGIADQLNSGTIQAKNGGIITLQGYLGTSLQNFEGQQGLIEADAGGTIQIASKIVGGQIRVVGNGRISFSPNTGFAGGTLTNSGSGAIQVLGANLQPISGIIVNPAGGLISATSTLALGPDGQIHNSGTILAPNMRISGLVTLDGGGTVGLQGDSMYSGGNPAGRLVNQDNLIHGNGEINLPITNSGVIDADVKNAPLNLLEPGTSNAGVLRASNGGQLTLAGRLSGSGQLQAAGGTISVTSSTGTNSAGAISVSAGGQLHLFSSSQLSGSDLNIDATGVIKVDASAGLGLSGNLSFAGTDKTKWAWAGTGAQTSPAASLTMTGGSGAVPGDWSHWASLEIGGRDYGLDPLTQKPVAAGFTNNFNLPDLHIGRGAHVFLTDLFDNGDRGGPGGASEAMYVNRLFFDDGAGQLNLDGLHLYYHTLQGSLAQIIDQPVPEPGALGIILTASSALLRRRKT